MKKFQFKKVDNKGSDFSLNFRDRKIYMSKKDFKIDSYLEISYIELELLDVGFPYDLSKGTKQLKNSRTKVSKLYISLYKEEVKDKFFNDLGDQFLKIDLNFENQVAIFSGIYLQNGVKIPFIFKVGAFIKDRSIILIILDIMVVGNISILKTELIDKILKNTKLKKISPFQYSIDLFPNIFIPITVSKGYKIPSFDNLIFKSLNFNSDLASIDIVDQNDIKGDIEISPQTIEKIELYNDRKNILNEIYIKKSLDKIKILSQNFDFISDPIYPLIYLEFMDIDFFSSEILNSILKKHNNNTIIVAVAQKFRELKLFDQYISTMELLIKQALKLEDFYLLEILYIDIAYHYLNNNNKKNIYYFEKLWNLNPFLKHIYIDFFNSLIKYEEYYLALEVGQQILSELNKSDKIAVLEGLGDIAFEQLKKYDKALDFYSYCLKMEPNLVIVKLKIIDIYIEKKGFKFATVKLNDLLENELSQFLENQIHKRLYIIWDKVGNYERALYHLEKIIFDKIDPELYWKATLLVRKLGDFERSKYYLRRIINHYEIYQIEQDDLYFKSVEHIASIYFQEGDDKKSLEFFRQIPIEKLSEGGTDKILSILFSYSLMGELIPYYKHLIDITKDFEDKADLWIELGDIYKESFNDIINYGICLIESLKIEYCDEIIKQLKEVINYLPDNYLVIFYTILIKNSKNNIEKSVLNFNIFNILYNKGERIEGIKFLKKALKLDNNNIEAEKAYKNIIRMKTIL